MKWLFNEMFLNCVIDQEILFDRNYIFKLFYKQQVSTSL